MNAELIELLREILTELKTISRNSAPYGFQDTRSPALSGNTLEEVPVTPDSKCTAMERSVSPNLPEERFSSTHSETLATMPVRTADKSERNATTQADGQAHPLEKSFWESIHSTCRRTCRDEFYKLASDVLHEVGKRSVLID